MSHRAVALAAAVVVLLLGGLLAVPLLAAATTATTATEPPVADIPDRVLTAYLAVDGWCPGLRWQLVAGIGSVESGHGTSGGATASADGEIAPRMFGRPLDGSPGVMALPIGKWDGWWGLTGPWQRAVGPMQFLPDTFERWAVDRDSDGISDPHDIDDATATAANYLCGGRDGGITDERAALLRYNRSDHYATRVVAYADRLSASAGGGGGWLCPVAGPVSFTDTWLAPRSGGRRHQGVDMFAARGTPVVAPVPGVVEHYADTLGGLSFRLWGDDGNYYYGTHLVAFGPVTGPVGAGTIVGFVGDTGNARGTGAHLHFEIHPGRRRGDSPRAINPTATVSQACDGQRLGIGAAGRD